MKKRYMYLLERIRDSLDWPKELVYGQNIDALVGELLTKSR